MIQAAFQDGTEGEMDLASELCGEVIEPLRDPAVFSQVQVDADLHAVFWPSGADFAPEFLYDRVRESA